MAPRRLARAPLLALALALALGATVLLGGCGRKGDPLPPGKRLPSAPSAVSLSAPDGKLTLSWSAPKEDLAGRTVLPLGGYAILRQSWPPEAKSCETCPEDLALVATLDSLERRSQRLPETSWTDPDVKPGWLYRYRVRALDADKKPGPASAPATIRWLPLAAPTAKAAPGDRQASLHVSAAATEGVAPLGVRVYEAESGRRLSEAAPGLADFTVQALPNGVPTTLSVRAAGRTAEGWDVESAGATVTVTPVDDTPPFPPTDLVGFATAEGVELRWLPSGRERYARQVVLRAPESGRFEELAAVPGDAVSYLDPTAEPGKAYLYSVAAFDAAGNRSLPARETRVSVPER